MDSNLITESGQQTHHISDGKIIIETGTEIALKVGDSFVRITPGAIFTQGNLNIGDSGPVTFFRVCLNVTVIIGSYKQDFFCISDGLCVAKEKYKS